MVLSHSASISGHETVSNVIHAVVVETVGLKSFISETVRDRSVVTQVVTMDNGSLIITNNNNNH